VLLVLLPAAGTAAAQSPRPFRACLVTGTGIEADAAIGRSAVAGIRAVERSGVSGRIIRSPSQAADAASLQSCVRGGADITIGVGYLMEPAIDEVATAYPRHVFVIVDASVTTLPTRPANVLGVLFRAEQAGYLAGYAAGLWTKEQGGKAVGAVGGLKIPPIDSYIAGFEAGATRAFPGVKTLHRYANNLTNESKCRTAALSQIAHGSLVELEVAGRCGLGVVSAARAKGVFAVGSDTDQSGLGPWVMTSAVKRVDVAVTSTIMSARSGLLRTGRNDVFGARRDGVGYGAWSPRVPRRIRIAVAHQLQLLEAGVVRDIPTTVD
jgi:basic membrane protein A